MPGRGRPPKAAEDKRDQRIEIRLTAEERRDLEAQLSSKDMTISAWARLRLREDSMDRRVTSLEAEVATMANRLIEINAALGAIGDAAGEAQS